MKYVVDRKLGFKIFLGNNQVNNEVINGQEIAFLWCFKIV